MTDAELDEIERACDGAVVSGSWRAAVLARVPALVAEVRRLRVCESDLGALVKAIGNGAVDGLTCMDIVRAAVAAPVAISSLSTSAGPTACTATRQTKVTP